MTKAITAVSVFLVVLAGFALFVAWLAFTDWVGERTNKGVSFVLALGMPIALLAALASLNV